MNLSHLIGILDMGTNSVMLTVGIADSCAPIQLQEYFRVTKLGDRVGQTGRLDEQAMIRTLDAAEEFVIRAKALGVKYFFGTATSAARDASNGPDFIKSAIEQLGFEPQLLSGPEEAELVFLGATADLQVGEFVITADPGGGSTEINIGRVGEIPLFSQSFNVGCIRQADGHKLFEIPEVGAIKRARQEIRHILQPAFAWIDNNLQGHRPGKLLISGGTSTTYGAVTLEMDDYKAENVHHLTCSAYQLEKWIERLFNMTSKERTQVKGLSDGRAPMLPAGLLIISELLSGTKHTSFTVTTRALRYGMLINESRRLLESINCVKRK